MSFSANMLMLYRNLLWSSVTPGATFTGSSAATSASNLRDPRPRKLWQTTGCADENVIIDFGSAGVFANALYLASPPPSRPDQPANGTPSFSAQLQVSLGWDATLAVPTFDTGLIDAWDPVYEYGEMYGLYYGGYAALPGFVWQKLIDLQGTQNFRYAKIRLKDPTNPAGFLRLSTAYLDTGFQPTHSFSKGWGVTPNDLSQVADLATGGVDINQNAIRRIINLPHNFITSDEAKAAVDDIKRLAGKSRYVVLCAFPVPTRAGDRRFMAYGLPKGEAITNPFFNVAASAFAVEEITE
jgi:hypothetical protein